MTGSAEGRPSGRPADPHECRYGGTHARVAHPGGRCIKCGESPAAASSEPVSAEATYEVLREAVDIADSYDCGCDRPGDPSCCISTHRYSALANARAALASARGETMTEQTWDPMPLARAVLADRWGSSPRLLLAAWMCVYRDDPRELTELAYAAARAAGGGPGDTA